MAKRRLSSRLLRSALSFLVLLAVLNSASVSIALRAGLLPMLGAYGRLVNG